MSGTRHKAPNDMLLAELGGDGFTGDVDTSRATMLVQATDNSIYQVEPAAVLYPRSTADLSCIMALSQRHGVPICARGGGTGTNGQSLTSSIVVDVSRHMNAVLGFDEETETVTVEPGVVLDQLNAYLKPLGYFFPPSVSTSSRATLGGMLATDASGKGSRRYGRTSDYVGDMEVVLSDATVARVPAALFPGGCTGNARLDAICGLVREEAGQHRGEVERVFPAMNRGLTGYNLKEVLRGDGALCLPKLLAGSEGTLALTSSIRFRVARLPVRKSLTVLAYDDCLKALDDVPRLVEADPLAIEFIDDRVVDLASRSPLWGGLEKTLGGLQGARGFLFVEFSEDSLEEIEARRARLDLLLGEPGARHIGRADTDVPAEMAALWDMRKKSVGLLGAVEGARRGIAFVEDAAVPPENLADFVRSFRALLDRLGLDYGMYGHADVGCVHVRPMLNMMDADDRALVRPISDEVAALALRNGGLIWGEHGKGYRGEYVPLYMGEALYDAMRRIKAAFDPHNLLNPGKLATADGSGTALERIDEVPFRGVLDGQVDLASHRRFERALACNGNGACFNWDAADAMCPSYKASRDRVQSPKGRAALLREWARLRSIGEDARVIADELHASLDTCLSCKACTSQCPVRVDIPAMKSAFLNIRYEKGGRGMRDRLLRHLEPLLLLGRKVPRLANLALHNPVADFLLQKVFGLCDLPAFPPVSLERQLKAAGVRLLGENLDLPAGVKPEDAVVLVPDSFAGLFEPHIFAAAASLFMRMGFTVLAAPVMANGKALHVRGYREAFEATARQAMARLEALSSTGAHIVSLEPAVSMLERQEYAALSPTPGHQLQTVDEFLYAQRERLAEAVSPGGQGDGYRLFLHCTEKTVQPETAERWRQIFSASGLSLGVEKTGCCGMAGLFGHEREHRAMSENLFDMSWRGPIGAHGELALVTGYSCRSQVKRLAGGRVRHPVEVL